MKIRNIRSGIGKEIKGVIIGAGEEKEVDITLKEFKELGLKGLEAIKEPVEKKKIAEKTKGDN